MKGARAVQAYRVLRAATLASVIRFIRVPALVGSAATAGLERTEFHPRACGRRSARFGKSGKPRAPPSDASMTGNG